MEEKLDAQEVLETPETDEETSEESTEETTEEADESSAPDPEKEQLKREKEELEKKNKQLYERVKKGEKKEDLSMTDVLALAKADVHEEDMETVIKWAKFNGVTVKESLGDKTLKAILNDRNEERKTAQATQTKGGARGSAKVTGEDLLNQARKGKLPDIDKDEDWDKLTLARLEGKRTKK